FEAFGRQREIGRASEVTRHHFGGVDDEHSLAFAHGREYFLVAGYDEVAAEDKVRFPSRDADRVDVFRPWRDANVTENGTALLREACHVDHAAALALDMGSHAQDGADGDDSSAADSVDDGRPAGRVQRITVRLRNALKRVRSA